MQTEMGLVQYVEKVFSSAYLGVKKPNPEFFAAILQELQAHTPTLQHEEVLLIDDDPDNVAGAQNFGIQSFLYQNYNDLTKVIG